MDSGEGQEAPALPTAMCPAQASQAVVPGADSRAGMPRREQTQDLFWGAGVSFSDLAQKGQDDI